MPSRYHVFVESERRNKALVGLLWASVRSHLLASHGQDARTLSSSESGIGQCFVAAD